MGIAACVGYSPHCTALGMSKAKLVAIIMGSLEMRRMLVAGSQLEFPRGTYRQTHLWFVYLAAADQTILFLMYK